MWTDKDAVTVRSIHVVEEWEQKITEGVLNGLKRRREHKVTEGVEAEKRRGQGVTEEYIIW